ncbi:hypothetical protein [Pseudonocardia nigra]|uniref:hypothetical protein n=1 Tax=Pseudonocardia nigra TaxID=1921578 RepID=UPI001C5D2DC0|nr:hypothetical protein [Pseudonocardia nigra]
MADANEAGRAAWTADDDRQLAEAVRLLHAGEDVNTRPGETCVPHWVMVALLLGLVALTGSAVAVVLVAAVGAVWWLLHTEATAEPRDGQEDGPVPRGPFGGPGIWL